MELLFDGIGSVEQHHDRSGPESLGKPQVPAHQLAAKRHLERARRRVHERGRLRVCADARGVQGALAIDVEEDHVLSEVVRRRRGQETARGIMGPPQGERIRRPE